MKTPLLDLEDGSLGGRKDSHKDRKFGGHKLPLGDSPGGLSM